MSKVEAFIAVEMNPSPLFLEESVKENLSYRNIVAWRGGKLQLYDKTLVKRFWHGSVGHDSAHSDKEKELETEIFKKANVICSKVEMMTLNDNLSDATDKLISCLEEQVRCKCCLKVPTSVPLYNCPEGHIICSSCHKGDTSACPSCRKPVGCSISLIGLTLIQNIKHSCPYPDCTERIDFVNIPEHKRICSFRPVVCPDAKCKIEVSFQKLLEHILKECKYSHCHQNSRTIVDTNRTTLNYHFDPEEGIKNDLTWYMETIHWKRKYFFLTAKTNASNNMTNVYIQMLGSSDDSLKYRVKLSIRNKEGLDLVSHCDHPFSVYMEEEDKVDGGLIIRTKNLIKACKPSANDSEKHKFAVRIKFEEI